MKGLKQLKPDVIHTMMQSYTYNNTDDTWGTRWGQIMPWRYPRPHLAAVLPAQPSSRAPGAPPG